MRARKLCSKYAELYGPGREHDRHVRLVGIDRRDRAQRLGQPGRVVVDAVDARAVEHLAGTCAWRAAGSPARTTRPTACAGCPRARARRRPDRGSDRRRRCGCARRPAAGRRAAAAGSPSTPSTSSARDAHRRRGSAARRRRRRGRHRARARAAVSPRSRCSQSRAETTRGMQAEREDLLGAAVVRVDGEGDALVEQRALGERLARAEVATAPGSERSDHAAEGPARSPVRLEHLVERAGQATVIGEERRAGREARSALHRGLLLGRGGEAAQVEGEPARGRGAWSGGGCDRGDDDAFPTPSLRLALVTGQSWIGASRRTPAVNGHAQSRVAARPGEDDGSLGGARGGARAGA